MVWGGKDPKGHLVINPSHRQGHLPLNRLLQPPCSLALNTGRDGASTIPSRRISFLKVLDSGFEPFKSSNNK